MVLLLKPPLPINWVALGKWPPFSEPYFCHRYRMDGLGSEKRRSLSTGLVTGIQGFVAGA